MYIFIICVYVYVQIGEYLHALSIEARSFRSSGATLLGVDELPDVGAGNYTQVL